MSDVRDIRVLAQRAELEFHVRPNIARRKQWWTGVALGLVCLAFIGFNTGRGHHQFYSAGSLSEAHAFIANDCRKCHNTWQPLNRLATLDPEIHLARHSSIDNQACLKCHNASEHHANQIPAHADLSCAACHREHQGSISLTSVTDQLCIRCHQDLKTADETPTQIAKNITGFGADQGHPEMHIWRRLTSPAPDEFAAILLSSDKTTDPVREGRDVLKRLKLNEHPLPESKSGLRDRTELKFNHATHFQADRITDRNGQKEDLAKNCQACHASDTAGQYMLPVNFEAHCQRCHPLWYDNQNHPDDEVPHERLELVRGYLTERYTLAAVRSPNPLLDQSPRKILPGIGSRQSLDAQQAKTLEQRVAQAESFVLEHTRQQLRGGCKLCHLIETSSPAAGEAMTGLRQIVPPDQPTRWLLQSRFDHQAHRMYECLACHEGVTTSRPVRESAASQSAADVLLPKMETCRVCHVSPNGEWQPAIDTQKQNREEVSRKFQTAHSVRSNCTMCHKYHN